MATDRILSIGEALVGEGNEIAHIDLLIGSKTGPVGAALVNTPVTSTCATGVLYTPASVPMLLVPGPEPIGEKYAPRLTSVFTCNARKLPSASSASATSVTLSRPW